MEDVLISFFEIEIGEYDWPKLSNFYIVKFGDIIDFSERISYSTTFDWTFQYIDETLEKFYVKLAESAINNDKYIQYLPESYTEYLNYLYSEQINILINDFINQYPRNGF